MKNKFFNIFIFSFMLIGVCSFSSNFYKKEFEIKSFQNSKTIYSNVKITPEKAKEIALKHAKVSKNNAKFTKIKLDKHKGTLVYEIEFYLDNVEYEYEIDANNGQILSFDLDKN